MGGWAILREGIVVFGLRDCEPAFVRVHCAELGVGVAVITVEDVARHLAVIEWGVVQGIFGWSWSSCNEGEESEQREESEHGVDWREVHRDSANGTEVNAIRNV